MSGRNASQSSLNRYCERQKEHLDFLGEQLPVGYTCRVAGRKQIRAKKSGSACSRVASGVASGVNGHRESLSPSTGSLDSDILSSLSGKCVQDVSVAQN